MIANDEAWADECLLSFDGRILEVFGYPGQDSYRYHAREPPDRGRRARQEGQTDGAAEAEDQGRGLRIGNLHGSLGARRAAPGAGPGGRR